MAVPSPWSYTASFRPEPFIPGAHTGLLPAQVLSLAFVTVPSLPTQPHSPCLPPEKLALSQGPGSGNPEYLETQRKGSLMVELEAAAETDVLELAPRGEMGPLLYIGSGLLRNRVLA